MGRPLRKKKTHTTLVVDGNSLLKTAYHGARNVFNRNGEHIGGIYQFITITRKILNENVCDRVIVFWDGTYSGKLRYEIYPQYKANRGKIYEGEKEPDEPEFYIQKERVKEYSEELFIRQYEDEICEADDCIAFYCENKRDNEKIIIASNDKDLCQLLSDDVSIYLLGKKKLITLDNYQKYINYHISNIVPVKVIAGDASDNIFGAQRVSENTLLKHFPEMKDRYVAVEEVLDKAKSIQESRKKPLKALDNILNRVSKTTYDGDLYELNKKLVDLSHPLLTETVKNDIITLINEPMDPEGRSHKNVLKMMIEDDFIRVIPGGHDGYVNYLEPFVRILKKETKNKN